MSRGISTVRVSHGLGAAILLALLAAGCGMRAPAVSGPASRAFPPTAILGPPRLTATQLVAWFNSRQPRLAGTYAAGVPIERLAQFYIEEGRIEGVTGDVAFAQGVLETGWFRFDGLVPASANNFAGIGATGAGPAAAAFPDARTGIRAQIQHLRAYADPSALTCASPPLAMPCADPRFHLVLPKGKAPTWNGLGRGNWASARGYGDRILALFDEALRFSARP